MKVRLMGTAGEVAAAVQALREVLDVVEVSGAFPSRGEGRLVRVYVEVRVPAAPGGVR